MEKTAGKGGSEEKCHGQSEAATWSKRGESSHVRTEVNLRQETLQQLYYSERICWKQPDTRPNGTTVAQVMHHAKGTRD